MRISNISEAEMTDEQKRALRGIDEGRAGIVNRTNDSEGPFPLLLRRPALADATQKLGLYVRLGSSLSPRIMEFAVILAARHWDAQYVWVAHRRHALNAGLDERIADDLSELKRPSYMKEDEEATYDFFSELHSRRKVSDEAYRRAVACFGEEGVIDLVAAYGYFSTLAMLLNVNESQPSSGPLMAVSHER